MRRNQLKWIPAVLLLPAFISFMLLGCKPTSGDYGKQLEQGFVNPPDDAKPRVWWHWMNGNITKEGIRADLEWMHRVGIGGFQNFDAGLTTPQIVEKRLIFMDPDWKDAFRFTAHLADSLGLEMAIAGSPGWSESGGPWVKPEQAMKKYVWSELRVDGGQQFTGTLPQPPEVTGTFQNIERGGEGFGRQQEETSEIPEFYADAAVIAFRIPDNDKTLQDLQPKITSSGGNFSLDFLTDGDLSNTSLLPSAPAGKSAWIQFEFDEPVTVTSVTLVTSGGGGFGFGRGSGTGNTTLKSSDDGITFNEVTSIQTGRASQTTLAFAPVKAKYFRYSVFTPEPEENPQVMGGMFGFGNFGQQAPPAGTQIAELVLNTGDRVNRFEDKAAFASVAGTELATLATPDAKEAIKKEDVVDLTGIMDADGKLDWSVPEGKWAILRIGYSLTGQQNRPASPEATGLEVDKLNPDYVNSYFTEYLNMYEDATGGLIGARGLQYIITDSWEAGTQNWTDNMITEFNKRRGYDMTPWLPVLSGYVVESAASSDKFLWDFRRTLEEMVAEYHYDQLTDILDERGMLGRYSESHEGGRALIGDGMEVKRGAAAPMSATWTPGGFGGNEGGVATRFKADVRESASVSHIYGQKYVAAESMTAIGTAWAWSPRLLKPVADMELASGLNQFVIHTSVHQPVDDKIPGLGLGPFGQWFTRHETWAEQAGAWTTYLARNSYMLQQGNSVVDVAYLYGEGNNITALFGQALPDVPAGYEFDFMNADALINVLSVKKGNMVTPSGMSYKLLALDESTAQMTLPVLKKISDMVKSGAVVAGNKPLSTPSLSDDVSEFETIVNELWPVEQGVTEIGKGKLYTGYTIKEVLDMMQVVPDFAYTKPQENTELLYVHHNLGDVDFYWVNNRNNQVEDVDATFRVEGKEAEIWHPETGKIEQASYTIEDGLTTVPMHLEPNDAVFVVFRNKTDQMNRTVPVSQHQVLYTVEGPWTVSFQENRGAPAQVTFDALTPWNENTDKGIKYFSGTGTYSKTINAPAEWFEESVELWLDLGEVENLAEVLVNGKSMGIVWKVPFKVDITDALKQGENSLEIKVTNLWVNRLIGDQQPDVKEKLTYTTQAFYQADSPLKSSGLLGPVRVTGLSKN